MSRSVVRGRGLVKKRGGVGIDVTPTDPDPDIPPLPNPPVFLSIVESSVTDTGCTLTITMDQPCQMYVKYDTNTGSVEADYPNSTSPENSFTYAQHVQRITAAPSTHIYYRAVATNTSGQKTVSAEGDFTTSAVVDPDASLYPPLVSQTIVSQPALTAPTTLQVKTFSDLGTEVTRVGVNPPIAGQGHRYSIPMAWNCDESILFLDYPNTSGSGDTRPLLNGQTLQVTRATNSAIGHFRWHPTIPNKGFGYANPNLFRRYTVSPTAGFTVEKTWTLSAYSQINYTGGNGRPDNTGRYHSFQFKKSNGDWGIAILDLGVDGLTSSNTPTIQEKVMGNSTADINTLLDASAMSWDGNYVIAIYEVDGTGTTGTGLTRGIWAYENGNLGAAGRKVSYHNSHSDVGQLANGAQVLVQASCASGGPLTGSNGQGGYVGTVRLDTGAWNPLVPSLTSAHVGCANIQMPDYAVLSNFSGSPTKEIWAIKLSTGQVRRFAWSHFQSRTAYVDEPQAVASPSMTRVIWRSGWDGGAVGCFVAGLDVIR